MSSNYLQWPINMVYLKTNANPLFQLFILTPVPISTTLLLTWLWLTRNQNSFTELLRSSNSIIIRVKEVIILSVVKHLHNHTGIRELMETSYVPLVTISKYFHEFYISAHQSIVGHQNLCELVCLIIKTNYQNPWILSLTKIAMILWSLW